MKKYNGKILVLDDDEDVLLTSQMILKQYFDVIETLPTPKSLETKLKQREYDVILHWYFLDDQINARYQSDRTARNQMMLFSVVSSGIACLGVLGMITNKLVEKHKEIGIRKVLGAQLHQIGWVLLNTTIKQLIISTVIGIPLAYHLTQVYPEKVYERITLQWWHYAIPVALLVFIMSLTIGSVLFRAARTNPVDSLRYE